MCWTAARDTRNVSAALRSRSVDHGTSCARYPSVWAAAERSPGVASCPGFVAAVCSGPLWVSLAGTRADLQRADRPSPTRTADGNQRDTALNEREWVLNRTSVLTNHPRIKGHEPALMIPERRLALALRQQEPSHRIPVNNGSQRVDPYRDRTANAPRVAGPFIADVIRSALGVVLPNARERRRQQGRLRTAAAGSRSVVASASTV